MKTLTLEAWAKMSAPIVRRLLRSSIRRQREREREIAKAWKNTPVGTTIRIRVPTA